MPPQPPADILMGLVSAATAPAVLITATAIFLSGLNGRQAQLATQVRALTAEHRHSDTAADRRVKIERQLPMFILRHTSLWTATILLSLALLAFLTTVLAAVFERQSNAMGSVGCAALVMGLLLVVCAVVVDLADVTLGRITLAYECEDALRSKKL